MRWLPLKTGQADALPPRVAERVRAHQSGTEKLIGWVQLSVVALFAVLYAAAPPTFDPERTFAPVPFVLTGYGAFTLLRLALAYRRRLPDWFLYLSIVVDIGLLIGLIWSFHLQYGQPAGFYLKAPTLLYVFIFIALRALRFEARFVLAAGITAAAGWLGLVGYALLPAGMSMITRDYVAYITSNKILLGAEVDKIISILVVTGILALALRRGRDLLVTAVHQQATAQDLARFLAKPLVERVQNAERIDAGAGEAREAAIVVFDLRGFTAAAEHVPPDELMGMLAAYQARVVPVIRAHGGAIDKFLGDGILATFDGAARPERYAADALDALHAGLAAADGLQREREAVGQLALPVKAAASSGRVIFGAVGTGDRLEYTVIGDAVNLAAKLEKHTQVAGCRALAPESTARLARAQGHTGAFTSLPATRVAGMAEPMVCAALA